MTYLDEKGEEKITALENIISFLNNNNISYKIDNLPSEQKIKRIKNTIYKNKQIMYLDEILEQSNTNSTRHKSKNGECHSELVFNKDSDIMKEQNDAVNEPELDVRAHYIKNLDSVGFSFEIEIEKQIIEDLERKEAVSVGVKENEGKTDYSEINLDILDLMASRFNANKHKYPKGNMKKQIEIKSLEWALFRHLKKMIQPIEGDKENYKDHISAILCNASMILDQINIK